VGKNGLTRRAKLDKEAYFFPQFLRKRALLGVNFLAENR